jgi:hypothetical protein
VVREEGELQLFCVDVCCSEVKSTVEHSCNLQLCTI